MCYWHITDRNRRSAGGAKVRWCAVAVWAAFALIAAPDAQAQPHDSPSPTLEEGFELSGDGMFHLSDQPVERSHGGRVLATDGQHFDRYPHKLTPNGPISPFLLPGPHTRRRYESAAGPGDPPSTYLHFLSWFGFRHSYTHGRHVGWGRPMVSSSWMNRPYHIGNSIGPMWMTRRVVSAVGRDVDPIANIYAGWDWDHYWGSEFEYAYATPELVNSNARDAHRGDRMAHWSYSFMYYPWGDAMIRPYWTFGIGNTKFDYPDDTGTRIDQWLLTFPIGFGVKYPLRRWLVARGEFVDMISVGDEQVATQHNLALVIGLECRFGARPKSFWPWYPSRYRR